MKRSRKNKKHKSPSKIRAERWRKAHPDLYRERIYAVRRKYPDRYRFTKLKASAKSRGAICQIEFSEYCRLANSPCYYCGGSLPIDGHGMDRINSDIGYVLGNIRPCCTRCNQAKNNMTEDEFRSWSLQLYKNWSSQPEQDNFREVA